MKRKPRPKGIERQYCDRCDGCGWYEGGTALRTTCDKCKGTGVVPVRVVRRAR